MPEKQVSINLIGEEEMEHTPAGRIVTWAVTYGRYIMIGTEIVVLLAFISRFSLDRKLTDLKEEITEKQDIIEANQEFESSFRVVQDQLTKIKTLISVPSEPLSALSTIKTLLPQDVHLESLDINDQRVIANAVAGTTDGFSQVVANLQAASAFRDVEIGDVKKSPISGIAFQFTALIGPAPTPGPKK